MFRYHLLEYDTVIPVGLYVGLCHALLIVIVSSFQSVFKFEVYLVVVAALATK